jgi:hypothetical protein
MAEVVGRLEFRIPTRSTRSRSAFWAREKGEEAVVRATGRKRQEETLADSFASRPEQLPAAAIIPGEQARLLP